MADKPVRGYSNPRSPGVSGAIKDALNEVAKFVSQPPTGPVRTRRQQQESQQLGEEENPIERMRQGQSTDSNNY